MCIGSNSPRHDRRPSPAVYPIRRRRARSCSPAVRCAICSLLVVGARAETTEQAEPSEKEQANSAEAPAAELQAAEPEKPAETPAKPKKRRRSWLRRIGVLFLFLLVVG